jgi:hypothetical protein
VNNWLEDGRAHNLQAVSFHAVCNQGTFTSVGTVHFQARISMLIGLQNII